MLLQELDHGQVIVPGRFDPHQNISLISTLLLQKHGQALEPGPTDREAALPNHTVRGQIVRCDLVGPLAGVPQS
jgi:hypothetical protein